MSSPPASDKGAAGSEEKGQTSPAQSVRRKEIGERAGVTDSIQQEAADAAVAMAASPASDKAAAGCDANGWTSPAGGGSLRTILFVLVAVATVAVPMRFHGQPMSQVWILSLNICSYVFFFLLCIWRSRWFYTDLVRLSYAPLLAFCSASVIGSATATFVLFFGTVWAAGNFGYSLAVHRLRKGAEPAIQALPIPSRPTKDTIEDLNSDLHFGAPLVVLLWTLVMVLIVNLLTLTDELLILMTLSYLGWIHVGCWAIYVALVPMHGVLIGKWMEWLLPSLLPCMVFSLLFVLVSKILAVLFHLLLTMALVAYLWYNLAIYIHFLETATPSTTTQTNEDTLHSEILGDKTGQMKSHPRCSETTSEPAATLMLSS